MAHAKSLPAQAQVSSDIRLVEVKSGETSPSLPAASEDVEDETPNSQDVWYKNRAWGGSQLRRIGLFAGLTDHELEDLYGLGTIKTVRAHAHVVIEGESTFGLYVVVEGTLSVYKTDPQTAAMQRLAYLEKGHCFGELSLIDQAPRSATVAADSPCILFHLEAQTFLGYLNELGDGTKARFYERCANELVVRLRQQNSDYIAAQQLLWRHALRQDTGDQASDDEKKVAVPRKVNT